MEDLSEYKATKDHERIFDELKGIRQDMKEMMALTRTEMNQNLKEIKDEITDLKTSHTETDRIARESLIISRNARNVIWGVGSVMILIIMGAIFNAGNIFGSG